MSYRGASMPQTYVFDLDGTLCTDTGGDYAAAAPLPWAIPRVNALKRAGHRITIFTARGTTTGIDWRPTAERQLADWGVEYDELVFGKPYGDVFIDDKALHADAWRYGGHARELDGPGQAPPRSATVIEVARTFGGVLFAVEEHALALLEAARAAGVRAAPQPEAVIAAVESATARGRELLDPEDDIVAVLSLAGPPHAGFLDTADGAADAELHVGCRLLRQPAAALGPMLEGDGVAAATDGRADAWPLDRTPTGGLRDRRGGDVAIVRDGRLELPSDCGVAAALARAVQTSAAEPEILVLGMPFCVLAVVRLDGEPVGSGRPGPVCRALERSWAQRTRVDVAAQRRCLVARAG